MGPPANASSSNIDQLVLRLSHTQANLLRTLDALDALQLSASKSQDTLQRKYDKLKMKCTAYLQCMNTLEAERDVMKDVVQELIAKVERNNGSVNTSIWHPSRILVNGHLARSLQPQIHQQLASASSQNSGGELEQRQAASIIHALQAQLESERHIRRDLEERIALLEAMVGRRDVEIQQLISKPPEKRSDSSILAQSLSGEDLSKLLDAQAKRNKDLEGEISALRIRLEKNPTSRVRTSRPRLRETPSVLPPRTASFPRPVHAQTAPAIPYSAPLEKLKSLRQSSPKRISSASSSGKRRRPASPPLAQLASDIAHVEQGIKALQEEKASGNRRKPSPPIRPLSAPPGKPSMFVQLGETIEILGREIEKLRVGREEFGHHNPLRQPQPESPTVDSPPMNFRGQFDVMSPPSPDHLVASPRPGPLPSRSSRSAPRRKGLSQPEPHNVLVEHVPSTPPPRRTSSSSSEAAQLRSQIADLRQQKTTLTTYATHEGFLDGRSDTVQEDYADASTLRPDPHPIQESDDTVSELGLDLTQPQTPVQEVDSPTQTFFPHRPSTPRSSQLAHVNGSLSFNTDSIYLQGTDPPTRHEAIWSDPDDPDGERSMELATPLVPSSSQLRLPLSSDSSEGEGDGRTDVEERHQHDDTDGEMSEATIPLPASPPGEDTYS